MRGTWTLYASGCDILRHPQYCSHNILGWLNLIMKKHQINSNWRPFHKITSLIHQICQCQEDKGRQRIWFTLKETKETTTCIMWFRTESWTAGGNSSQRHYWDNWQNWNVAPRLIKVLYHINIITTLYYHRLNICVPPKLMLNPNAQGDGIWRLVLWAVIRYEPSWVASVLS